MNDFIFFGTTTYVFTTGNGTLFILSNGIIYGSLTVAGIRVEAYTNKLTNIQFMNSLTAIGCIVVRGQTEINNCFFAGDCANTSGIIEQWSGLLVMKSNIIQLKSNVANRCFLRTFADAPIIFTHNICISDYPAHANAHVFIPAGAAYPSICCLNENVVVNNPAFFARYLGNV
jgi:hypothetical protein